MTERRCSFCGAASGVYAEGFYSCGADDCERQLAEALRERDEAAREDAAADNFDRYR